MLRSRVLRVVALVAVATAVATPAHADHNVVWAHWPEYRWAGVHEFPGYRSFYVFDRSNVPTFWTALNNVAAQWNALPEVQNQAVNHLPLIAVYQDTANGGDGSARCLANGTANSSPPTLVANPGEQYSVALMCYEPTITVPNSTRGVSWVRTTSGSHATLDIPMFALSNITLNGGASLAETIIKHELMHIMGINHSYDCSALMSSTATGCPLVPAGRSWTNHDIAAAVNFYAGHPMSQ